MATMRSTMRSLHSLRLLSSNPTPSLLSARSFHTDDIFGDSNRGGGNDSNPFESAGDFEKRLFGSDPKPGGGDGPISDSFFRKLDRIERRSSPSAGFGPRGRMDDGGIGDGMMEGFDTLSDGMDDKLKKAATNFQVSDEIENDDYAFRPDVTFVPQTTYTLRDLDLTKPGVQKSFKRKEFVTTTVEVLEKADFRNVRFLSNFLTEAGIIIKRSQTKISAKAQRKVAREIKTARAFGLMPFTTMGTKPFIFGRSMEDVEEDYEYDMCYGNNMNAAAVEPVNDAAVEPVNAAAVEPVNDAAVEPDEADLS